jgi:hypothetical protein
MQKEISDEGVFCGSSQQSIIKSFPHPELAREGGS